MASPWVGQLFGNHVARAVLARGGMGLVLAGEHRFLGEPVAIKILDERWANDPEMALRFFQEAQALRGIQHPNLPRLIDFGAHEPTGSPYLIMERFAGETLGAALRARGRIFEPEAARIGAHVAAALTAVHARGFVHRDIKPDNVLLCDDGSAKLLDLGVAKARAGFDVTDPAILLGTPRYLAPEQLTRGQVVGPAADVYSLGALLFHMITGAAPFDAEDLLGLMQQTACTPPPRPSTRAPVSPGMEALILQCLEKDPSLRPASTEDVVRRLVPLAGDHANAQAVRSESQAPWRQGLVAAPWPSRDQTPAAVGQLFDGHRRPRRRVPLWALLAGAVLVGALADAAGVLLARGALSSEPPASAAAPACVCPVDAGDPEK